MCDDLIPDSKLSQWPASAPESFASVIRFRSMLVVGVLTTVLGSLSTMVLMSSYAAFTLFLNDSVMRHTP